MENGHHWKAYEQGARFTEIAKNMALAGARQRRSIPRSLMQRLADFFSPTANPHTKDTP